jgi:hypothetical protein
MATRREAEARTEGTILADSRGARKRFGFGGAPESAITTAPKMADQWFVEFTNTTGSVNDISAQAQSVSPITIQTTTQPVDRYGKREYIPTRVDFPEVTVTFYDTVDGKTMIFAKDIYAKLFKNSGLNVDAGNMQSTIEDINSGRKFPSGSQIASHKNFDKVTVYHFFGSFDNGDGFIQRIVLINPVVTSITFSESDYSQSALRTISITLQPENVVFGTPTQPPAVPQWMQEGLEFILEDLSVDNSDFVTSRLRENLRINRELEVFEVDTDAANVARDAANQQAQQRQLQELQKFYQAMKRAENDRNSTNEDKARAISDFMEARYAMSPVAVNSQMTETVERASTSQIGYKPVDIASQQTAAGQALSDIMARQSAEQAEARRLRYSRGQSFGNTFEPSTEIPDTFVNNNNNYQTNTLIPGISQSPQLAGSNYSSMVGGDFYGSRDLASSIRNELVSSFFNGRKIDIGNITRDVTQGILGNSGIGNLTGLSIGSQSRFGIAGDLIRDSLISNSRVSNNSRPVGSISTGSTSIAPRDSKQNSIQNIGNLIRRTLR